MDTLYSDGAREPIAAAQEEIKRRGLEPTAEGIRNFRTLVLSGAFDSELAELTSGKEFRNLSGCRDLLFRVQEQRFTVPQISEAMSALDLALIGFDLSYAYIPKGSFDGSRNAVTMTDFSTFERL